MNACISKRLRYNSSTSQKTKLGFDDSSQAQSSRATTNGSGFFIASPRNRFGGACGTPQGVQFLRLFVNPHVLPPLFDDCGAGLQLVSQESSMTNALTIGTSAVRQLDNLFSLNDLHKASGKLAKHQPAQFLRLDQTQALIVEIGKYADSHTLAIKVVQGRNGGTFVSKEIVYAYAMWIDAAFALKVIRTFDAAQTQAALPATSLTLAQQQQLKAAVQTVCKNDPKAYSQLYKALYARFGVPKYQDLQQVDFIDAVGFIGNYQVQAIEPVPTLLNRRWLMAYDHTGKEQIQPVPSNACVAAPEEWAKMIREAGGLFLEPQTLADIATACTERLARQSASYMQSSQALRLKLQSQERSIA